MIIGPAGRMKAGGFRQQTVIVGGCFSIEESAALCRGNVEPFNSILSIVFPEPPSQ